MSDIPIPAGLQEDTLDHTVEILAKQFKDDAFQRYILLDELKKNGKRDIETEFNIAVFDFVVRGMVKGGARCITVEKSGVTSVWELNPTTSAYTPSPHDPPAVIELNALAHAARKPHLSPQTTHVLHLVLLANDRSHPSNDPVRNSKVSHVIRPVLSMAQEKGWPVVLEATSARSRDVYRHLGFDVLEEVTVGKGRVDAEGRGKEGGEGCVLWVMMKGC